MKKTFVIALSILMLFSFIACNNNSIPGGMIPPGVIGPTPGGGDSSTESVNTAQNLLSALADTSVKTINMTGDIDIPADGLAIDNNKSFTGAGSLVFNSNSGTIVIENGSDVSGLKLEIGSDNVSLLSSTEESENILKVISVTGNNTTMSNVVINVGAVSGAKYNIITVEPTASNFTLTNSTITGDIKDFTSINDYTANIAVAVSSGSSATISNSTITGCYTPVYASTSNIVIDGLHFESGIQLDTVSASTVVKNSFDVEGCYRAKVDIMAGAGEAELVKSKIIEFVKNNNNVYITSEGKEPNDILTAYLLNASFGSLRLFNNLFGVAKGDNAAGFTTVTPKVESTQIVFEGIQLDGYGYGKEGITASGIVDVTLTGEMNTSTFVVNSVTISSDDLTVEGASPSIVYLSGFDVTTGLSSNLSIPVEGNELKYTSDCYDNNKLTAPTSVPTGTTVNGWIVK